MKRKYSVKLWERMSCVSLSLLVLAYAGYGTAAANAASINSALGGSSGTKSGASGENIYYASDYDNEEDLTAYLQETGTLLESEGMVLLKNENNALPLDKDEGVSCFLSGSVKFNYSSSGSSAAETSGYPTLKEALTDSGLSVNDTLWNFYTEGDGKNYGRTTMGNTYLINEAGWDVYPSDVVDSVKEYGTVIVNIARDSGEGKDISTVKSDGEDGSYLSLSAQEKEVLQQLTKMKKDGTVSKIIVLLKF